MIEIKKQNGQKLFIRAKSKKTGKFEYVGFIPKNWIYHKVLVTSWLLRFGGYSEVRYYDPKTKRRLEEWNLATHEKFCRCVRYNDWVNKNTEYFVKKKVI